MFRPIAGSDRLAGTLNEPQPKPQPLQARQHNRPPAGRPECPMVGLQAQYAPHVHKLNPIRRRHKT